MCLRLILFLSFWLRVCLLYIIVFMVEDAKCTEASGVRLQYIDGNNRGIHRASFFFFIDADCFQLTGILLLSEKLIDIDSLNLS